MTLLSSTETAVLPDRVDALLRTTVDLASDEPPDTSLARTLQDYQRLALQPGTLVAVVMPNGTALLRQFFATVLSGLVPVVVPPTTPRARLDELAAHLNVGAYVTNRRQVTRFGTKPAYEVGPERLVRPSATAEHPEQYVPGDVVMLTSGTSGMFSACVNRIDALLRNASRHNTHVGVRAGDTTLVTLPLYYSYALVAQAMGALVAGARLVIDGPPFQPQQYRNTLTRHGIDVSAITPTLARQLVAERVPLPDRLRTLTVGGDQLTAHRVGELLALHRNELYLTYGLTEAGPRVATLAAHREPRRRWSSVGLPLPGVRVALRNVRADGVGELTVESDTVLTRRAGQVRDQPLLAPGRIATGDLFSLDDDGYLFFRGRSRDFVVARGEKLSLHTMRLAAETVPGVVHARTSVTGADEGPEVELVAHVADPSVTTADVVTSCLDRLLMRKERPHRVRVVGADHARFHK